MSKNHRETQQYIVDFLNKLPNWSEVHRLPFNQSTVIGNVQFVNIVSVQDPTKRRRLTLACHYESKLKPTGFIGATDSALPCSIMLRVAQLVSSLKSTSDSANDLDVSLELVFFDGEEAFHEWSAQDSIYGSKRLATDWSARTDDVTQCTRLQQIDVFMLLDLLGERDPKFGHFSHANPQHHRLFQTLEKKLIKLNAFKARDHPFFPTNRKSPPGIQDDHTPFLNRNVEVMHLIPYPFPTVWHDITDDASALDWPTCADLELLTAAWVSSYLHLGPNIARFPAEHTRTTRGGHQHADSDL